MKKYRRIYICLGLIIAVSFLWLHFSKDTKLKNKDRGDSLLVKQIDLKIMNNYFKDKENFVFILSRQNCLYCEKLKEMLNTTNYTLKEDILILNYKNIEREAVLNALKKNFNEVQSVPSIYIIKDGVVIDNMIGYTEEGKYWDFIYQHF